MSVSLPGGYTITFSLKVSGGPVKAVAFPTFGDAYLGNSGHYSGVSGKPALYQTTNATTTTATLTNIKVIDGSGAAVTGYGFVGADAESTDPGESITWSSNTPFALISSLGNACNSGASLTGVGTTTVVCTGVKSGTKTGTAILAAQTPTTISQTMVGSGLQAVAFGVLVSSVRLTTVVASRIDSSDAFRDAIQSGSGTVLASAGTGTADSATTGRITVLTSNLGADYTLSATQVSGITSNYNASWSCQRNGATDPALPTGDAGSAATVTLGIGDFVDCTVTVTAKVASLALTKHAGTPADLNGDGITDAGDSITYSFTVTNNGVLPLTSVAVSDPLVGAVTCPTTSLASGYSVTCSATSPYTVTTSNEATGAVTNTATATALPPGTTAPITSAPSSTTTPAAAPHPAVSLAKIANASAGDTTPLQLGETIAYSYLVTNTGNINLTSVAVDDPGTGSVTCPTPAAPGLTPGGSLTCSADAAHTVTTTDIAAGSVTDTATATGTGDGLTSPPSSPATVVVPSSGPAPTVALEKLATITPAADADRARLGDSIAYSYTVTNTGNVDLASVAVDDPSTGSVACPTPASPGLAPGDSLACSADAAHIVTQADLDAGSVTDTATATGTGAGITSPPSAPAKVTVATEDGDPAVSLTKTATVSPSENQDGARLGDSIAYSYTVTNTGNVDLASVAIDDPAGGSVTCPTPASPGLAPGASLTCSADAAHIVTMDDVTAGAITDTATATGTDGAGITSDPSAPANVTVPTGAEPRVSLDKAAIFSPSGDEGRAAYGDSIAYSYAVTNTGDVDLTAIHVDDPAVGDITCPDLGRPGLAPHAMVTCTARDPHVVTSADVSAGHVTDTATATGTDAAGRTSPHSDPSTVTIPTTERDPRVSVEKSAVVVPGGTPGIAELGDLITYAYTVTNVGNVDLASVAVDDPAIGPVTCPVPSSPGLGVGDLLTCTAVRAHLVSGEDVAAGQVTNTATASGIAVEGNQSPRSSPSSATVKVAAVPGVPPNDGRIAESDLTPGAPGPLVDEVASISTDLGRWRPPPGVRARSLPPITKAGSGHAAIEIPALGLDASLEAIGASGPPNRSVLSVPSDIDAVGWWDGLVTVGNTTIHEPAPWPGSPGVAIIAGHADSAAIGPGAFYKLGSLRVGDRIDVVDLEGRSTDWRVIASPQLVDKQALPVALFATSGAVRLALVTCGGAFDAGTGHYEDNVIVWAAPAG